MATSIQHIPTVLLEKGLVVAPIIVIILGVFVFFRIFNSDIAKVPLLGKEYGNSVQRRKAYLANAARFYNKGYQTFKNQAYRLTTLDGDRIVVPNSALDELRRLPDDQISNRKALERAVESKYTGLGKLGGDGKFFSHIVRADLTHSLGRINPRLSEEVSRTVDAEIGPCEDWTAVAIHQKLLQIVAIVSGNIFLGPDLCRRNEYLHASIKFTVDVFAAVRQLKRWNPWLRPIAQYFIPELRTLSQHRQTARNFLVPIIRQRNEAMRNGEETPDDMLQWMIAKAEEYNKSDEVLAETQLSLSLAAIHTTTMTTTFILGDLVTRPELVEELREEIKQVLKENNGVMTTKALFNLKLLDSVMRESQRVNPFSLAKFSRYINKPVTLSSGIHIPAGYVIETAFGPMIRDPNLYPDPETYDPHRFANLRNETTPDPIKYKNKEQYQFVTVTKENMSFGFGRHACPGRFFAANEIKLILARMLLNYDLRMPEGAEDMYSKITAGASASPNPRIKMELKKVPTEA